MVVMLSLFLCFVKGFQIKILLRSETMEFVIDICVYQN